MNIAIPAAGGTLTYWESYDLSGFDIAVVSVSANGAPYVELERHQGVSIRGWQRRNLSLSAFAGSSINVRWTVNTGRNYKSNYFIDDVLIR